MMEENNIDKSINEKSEPDKELIKSPTQKDTSSSKQKNIALVVVGIIILVLNTMYELPGQEILGKQFINVLGVMLVLFGGFPLLKTKSREKTEDAVGKKTYTTQQLIDYIFRHHRLFETAWGHVNLTDIIGPFQECYQDPNPDYLRMLFIVRREPDGHFSGSVPIEEKDKYTHVVLSINRNDPDDFRLARVSISPNITYRDKKELILSLALTPTKSSFPQDDEKYPSWLMDKYRKRPSHDYQYRESEESNY